MKKQIILKTLMFCIFLSLCSCGDMIDGAGHMAYGFTTFMIGLFKFVVIVVLIIVAVAFIINIIKAIFK